MLGDISNGKLRLPPEPFTFIMSKDRQERGGAVILAWVTYLGHQAEAGLLFPPGARRTMCASQVISWHLLVLSCPTVTVNGQAQQLQTEKVSEHSRMKVWVPSPGKPPRPAEKIAEGSLSPATSQTWPQLFTTHQQVLLDFPVKSIS